jgi:autotransporter-associated beta strand protein
VGAIVFQNGSSASAGPGAVKLTNGFEIFFQNQSSAGSAAIANNGDLEFHDQSHGGTAAIISNGTLFFFEQSGAGTANIINNATLTFNASSSAESSTITNANLSTLTFTGMSSAGSSAITTQNGALTSFQGSSGGGTAHLITDAGGSVDISGLTVAGLTVGAIEGAGNYKLGSKQLTVGNSLSTTVSGVISDGGAFGGNGGSLVKVGTGTLTLSGPNTYNGGTTLKAGIVVVGISAVATPQFIISSAIGTGTLTFDGGTLQAGGPFGVPNAVTLNPGGGTIDAATHNFPFEGDITNGSGAPTLTITSTGGPGVVPFSGNNTYSGPTIVAAGADLAALSATALSSNSDFTVNGTLGLQGNNNTIRSLSGSGAVGNFAGNSHHRATEWSVHFLGPYRRRPRGRVFARQGRRGNRDPHRQQQLHGRHDVQCRHALGILGRQSRRSRRRAHLQRRHAASDRHELHLDAAHDHVGPERRRFRYRGCRERFYALASPDWNRAPDEARPGHAGSGGCEHLFGRHLGQWRHLTGRRHERLLAEQRPLGCERRHPRPEWFQPEDRLARWRWQCDARNGDAHDGQ